jgi:hypothetical protein
MDERIALVKRLRTELGRLKLVRALSASPRLLRLAAEGSRGPAIELTFELDDQGKLEGIRIAVGGPAPAEAKPVDDAERSRVVEAGCKALEERYVYPEVAAKMAAFVRKRAADGAYDKLTDTFEFTRQLTDDFRSVSNDRHLGVRPAPRTNAHARESGARRLHGAGDNYAYRKVEVLPNNIGYLRLDLFVGAPQALERATAAFGFLADVDGLIVDLRHNGGGDPEAIRFITSYLFDEPAHLNDMVDRDGKVVEEYWTLKEIPGKRLKAEIPVAVLTSGYTFSGAEEFAYNLQNLNRATIIGETTGGGAHPVTMVRLTDGIEIGVPFMRARNPISRTNWEGAGVSPDIAVPADQALERAQSELAKSIASRRPSSGS